MTALDEAFERRDLEAVIDLCSRDVVFIGSGEGEEGLGDGGTPGAGFKCWINRGVNRWFDCWIGCEIGWGLGHTGRS